MNLQILDIPILICFGLISLQILGTNTIPVNSIDVKKNPAQEVDPTLNRSQNFLKIFDQNNRLLKKHMNTILGPQNSSEISRNPVIKHTPNFTQSYRTSSKSSVKPLRLFGPFNQAAFPSNNSKSITESRPMQSTKMTKSRSPNSSAITIASVKAHPFPSLKPTISAKTAYNPWGVTYGHIFMDTRSNNDETRSREPIKINPPKVFNPESGEMSTVCLGSTIPYLDQKIMKWLDRHVYKRRHSKRPYYFDLRRQIFFEGNSEECHSPNQTSWDLYQNCALRRNQRLEYKVPHYPVHQNVKT